MTEVLSKIEQLFFCTVRIECKLLDGSVNTGTGFFFQFLKNPDTNYPAIVTNWHVVEGAVEGTFFVHRADPDRTPVVGAHGPVVLDNFEQRWIRHPDLSVDLAIMPIGWLLNWAADNRDWIYHRAFEASQIPTAVQFRELTALQDIVMIGYPIGILDSRNNMPVARRGITANHPYLDYEGKAEFLIDAACFPGSSGSPVLLFNQGSYPDRQGNMILGSRLFFLGVLYAGPQYTAEGEVHIVNVPTQRRIFTSSLIPTNLGVVIRASRLLEFEPVLQEKISASGSP